MNLDKRIEEGIQKLLRQKKAIAKRGEDTKAIDKKIKDKAKEGRTRARKRAGGGNKPGSIAHGTEQALKPGTSRSGSWPAGANRPKGSTQWQRESTLKEGIRRTLRKSIAAIKASTKEVPGYKPGGSMGKNPHAAELRKQIKQGRERAAKNKRPATGTETALKNALEKLKKKPRIEDYMSKKERENLLRLQGGENSSTEYEGPSLSEQAEFIKTFLEGKTTGGDLKATADRLGKWYKGIKPDAKPGEKGYMRGRNVPPTDPKHPGSKYDPTKHEAPVKGKPLKYMKPQHKDYARSKIGSQVAKIAFKKADRDTPKGGNINKRYKEKADKIHAYTRKGQDILKKHGAEDPPMSAMFNKWVRGNNPRSRDNPIGYAIQRTTGKPYRQTKAERKGKPLKWKTEKKRIIRAKRGARKTLR